MPGRRRTTWPGGCVGSKAMEKKPMDIPKFANEAEEADWWAGREGREFVKRKSVGPPKKGSVSKGSRLVGQLNRSSSVQIALRLPGPDVTKARERATTEGDALPPPGEWWWSGGAPAGGGKPCVCGRLPPGGVLGTPFRLCFALSRA